jgi:hypothetical protein
MVGGVTTIPHGSPMHGVMPDRFKAAGPSGAVGDPPHAASETVARMAKEREKRDGVKERAMVTDLCEELGVGWFPPSANAERTPRETSRE